MKETPSRNKVSFTPYTGGSLTYLHVAITWAASKLLIPGPHQQTAVQKIPGVLMCREVWDRHRVPFFSHQVKEDTHLL